MRRRSPRFLHFGAANFRADNHVNLNSVACASTTSVSDARSALMALRAWRWSLAGKGSYLGGSSVVGWGSHGYRALASKNLKAEPEAKKPKPPKPTKLRTGGPSTGEVKHFAFGGKSLDRILDDLEPKVWTLHSSGVEKPEDVARLLNAARIPTACGAEWTPQLALFLLGFIRKRHPGRWSQKRPISRPATLEEKGLRLRPVRK